MSSADIVIVLKTEPFDRSSVGEEPDPLMSDVVGDLYAQRQPRVPSIVPRHPSDAAEDFEFITWMAGKLAQAKEAGRTEIQTPDGEGAVALYRAALQEAGISNASFRIEWRLPSGEPSSVYGLRFKYLINALYGTIGAKRQLLPDIAADINELPPLFRELIELAKVAGADEQGLNEGKYDRHIGKLRDDFDVLDKIANAVDVPESQIRIWWDGGQMQIPFYPDGTWQSIRIPMEHPPARNLSTQLYDSPAFISVRNLRWETDDEPLEADIQAHQFLMRWVGPLNKDIHLEGVGFLSTQTHASRGVKALAMDVRVEAGLATLKGCIAIAVGNLHKKRMAAREGRA